MEDVEVQSLLLKAGYRFNAQTGRYLTSDAAEGDVDYATGDVADELEIPVEDLLRWEQEQKVS